MQRLLRESFTFEKQKYTFIVDTDGALLFLKCFKGSSEKNESVPLQRFSPIEKKVMSVINDSIGSAMVNDLRKDVKRVSPYVRKYFRIPFPEINELLTLDVNIENNGYVIYEDELVLDYLENKELPFVTVEYEGKKYAFTSKVKLHEFQEQLMEQIRKKRDEIKQLHDLETDIFYKSERTFGKRESF